MSDAKRAGGCMSDHGAGGCMSDVERVGGCMSDAGAGGCMSDTGAGGCMSDTGAGGCMSDGRESRWLYVGAPEPVVVCRDLWLVCGIRHGSTLLQLLPLLNSEERRRGPTARGAEQVARGRGNWSVVVTGDVLRLGGFGADSQVQGHTYSTDHQVTRRYQQNPNVLVISVHYFFI
jgi:hypothetical protein